MRDALLTIGLTLIVSVGIVRSDRKAERRNEESCLRMRLLAQKEQEEARD